MINNPMFLKVGFTTKNTALVNHKALIKNINTSLFIF